MEKEIEEVEEEEKKKKEKMQTKRERLLLPEFAGRGTLPKLKEEEGRDRVSVEGEGKTRVREGERGKTLPGFLDENGGNTEKFKIEPELKPNRVDLTCFPF